MNAISQQDWQDQEDGRALRELREALPEGWSITVDDCVGDAHVRVRNEQGVSMIGYHRATLAHSADACRAALRERAK